jgi:hypothetical protein
MVLRRYPEAEGVNFFYTSVGDEPCFIPKGAGAFRELIKLEGHIVEAGPAVVIPDPVKWVGLNTVGGRVLKEEIGKRFGTKYITEEMIIAFVFFHEIYHAMYFMNTEAPKAWRYIAAERQAAEKIYGRPATIEEAERIYRLLPSEREADKFAEEMVMDNWNEIFPVRYQEVAISACGISSFPGFTAWEVKSKFQRWEEEREARELSRRREERRKKEAERSLWGRAKKAVTKFGKVVEEKLVSKSEALIVGCSIGAFAGALISKLF